MPEWKFDVDSGWIKIPVAVAIGAIGFQLWGTWEKHLTDDMMRNLQEDQTISRLTEKIAMCEKAIQEIPPIIPAANRWTCIEQERFLVRLSKANPNLNVPPIGKECTP